MKFKLNFHMIPVMNLCRDLLKDLVQVFFWFRTDLKWCKPQSSSYEIHAWDYNQIIFVTCNVRILKDPLGFGAAAAVMNSIYRSI